MDYKYIEQLLQRYWECETSIQEESILRNFFTQDDVPAHLSAYKEFFQELPKVGESLSDDFDERIMALVEEAAGNEKNALQTVKAHRLKFSYGIRPFFKAAAMVAVVLSISLAVQQAMYQDQSENDNVVSLPPAVVPGSPETALGHTGAPTLPDTLDIEVNNLPAKENVALPQ